MKQLLMMLSAMKIHEVRRFQLLKESQGWLLLYMSCVIIQLPERFYKNSFFNVSSEVQKEGSNCLECQRKFFLYLLGSWITYQTQLRFSFTVYIDIYTVSLSLKVGDWDIYLVSIAAALNVNLFTKVNHMHVQI